ncbi:phosphodiester glycosidase family protein [Agriterribacter sp.]|uniref:phosphodiester glycosidase family protein n=1 Tax=Agriterribacter sp. TaxID=2821509 RepID=UPI002C16D757|nr:phosphodiester glycosidase family protein [Agriterribacter sp.]HRO46387.1 phosphodiester glycosidase family protein [Agriterribacter sp.]HRQ17575.1 phosphodiester glycosidase family protein [Agriterribacter sp.]
MKRIIAILLINVVVLQAHAQTEWTNVDSLFGKLPPSVHVYKTTRELDGKPNIAYYVEADLKDRRLIFSSDTTRNRRLTPDEFYRKNSKPVVVVNCTFFSFATHQNLNTVIKEGKIVSRDIYSRKRADSATYVHSFGSAIGITRQRNADVAWVYAEDTKKKILALQRPVTAFTDSHSLYKPGINAVNIVDSGAKKWKMRTAVGGGPVLLQEGEIKITNNEELKFAGKAIHDKHPRSGMGYTKNNKLIILVIEGRNKGVAEGATLLQEAQLFKELGCWEALNLDGGGSSCMLVNGRETIYPSDKKQRPVPAVFMIEAL